MLVTSSNDIKLGNIKYGQPQNFKYTLTNVSDKPIKVERLMVSCTACTTASMKKALLQPNETGEVDVVFTPGSLGVAKKSVTVVYTGNQTLLLNFNATVEK